MPQLIKVEQDDGVNGYAIRQWTIGGWEFLWKMDDKEFWGYGWEYSKQFLFNSEKNALDYWDKIIKMRKIKRKITVIKKL